LPIMNFGWVLKDELAGSQGPASFQDLLFLHSQGVRAVIRMEERTIAADSGNVANLVDMFVPVPDFTPPKLEQIQRMVEFIDQQTNERNPVVVSCYAGIGRTGTVLACYLVHRGEEATEAISRVRQLRPGSVQTLEQEAAVHQYAEWAKQSGN
jgi:atypical dual specificity phosphatase